MAQYRIEVTCKDRTREEILSQISKGLASAPSRGEKSAWIILEDLAMARDSVSKLLSELVRLAARRSAHLVVADASGLARTFLEGIGGAEPFVTLTRRHKSG